MPKSKGKGVDLSKDLGLDPKALSRLVETIQKDIAQELYDGAVFIVARHGEIAMHETIGHTDLAN